MVVEVGVEEDGEVKIIEGGDVEEYAIQCVAGCVDDGITVVWKDKDF